MRPIFHNFPVAALWQEPIAYMKYRSRATLVWVLDVGGYDDYEDWQNKHENPTYDQARFMLMGVCAAGLAIYAVNKQSKQEEAKPSDGAWALVLGATGGALFGAYAHLCVPLVLGYGGFSVAFKLLQMHHRHD